MEETGKAHPPAFESPNKPLMGRTALVTGGARRIGRGIGMALASAGADVAFTYNRSRTDAEDTLAALRELGVRAHALPCDLHDAEAVARVLPQLSEWLAGGAHTEPALDILVNNAGTFEVAGLDELTSTQWDAMFATNTRAPFLMAQAALPYLRRSQQTGRIVNIGSLGGMHPAHADADHGQRLGTAARGELRSPGNDRHGLRARRGLRALCSENPDAAQWAGAGCR
jgi:NAD(P)-dependent dehydrogenase (short-subunit alcohol dehydrogenase family)